MDTFSFFKSLITDFNPLGLQANIFGACPKPGQNGRVAAGRASGIKMGDDTGGPLTSRME